METYFSSFFQTTKLTRIFIETILLWLYSFTHDLGVQRLSIEYILCTLFITTLHLSSLQRWDRPIQSTRGSTRRHGNIQRHLVSVLDYAAPTTAITTATQTWTATAPTASHRTLHQMAPVVDTDEIICSLPAQVKRPWGSYLDNHAHVYTVVQ